MCNVLTGYPTYGSLAAAATYELDVPLPYMTEEEECLTQLEVSVKEPINTTTTMYFMFAEAYLIRAANLERILLDRGIVVGGFGQRNMVGMVGRVGYSDGDFLHIVLKNTSGQTVLWNIEAAYEHWVSGPDAYKGNCQGISRLSKKVRVFYAARRVATQANGAGGAIKIDLAFAANQAASVVTFRCANSGTNGLYGIVNDEDDANHTNLASIGSAASTSFTVPGSATSPVTSGNYADFGGQGILIASGQKLVVEQSGAGAAADNLTISLTVELFGMPDAPTWSKARSTNQADVTLAASTISESGTWTCVVCE